ncbi:MAG: hypothetical protein U9R08_01105 [Nanoarchaeota archaeon]|nr:hypothetical protein [Nanoarchaeota archaeon]
MILTKEIMSKKLDFFKEMEKRLPDSYYTKKTEVITTLPRQSIITGG